MRSKVQGVGAGDSNAILAGGILPRRAMRLGFLAAALAAVVVLGLSGLAPSAAAGGAPDAAAGAKTFKTNCVMCHGEDGKGTPTGQALKVADLTSDAVQKLPVAELVKVVTNGKNNMPPFKATLNADQIQGVVAYVRQLGKKK
ncbi:MAG: cytochrome c [Acidobacteriia bacterium]|nr:cytochrome c [Terriglobia bacterium]